MDFKRLKNVKEKGYGIQYKDVNIVNPFDYTEKYEKDTKK